ncbi:MAG TPA: universal stress protein [Candidatus Dormibacteraeota bacterium]|nr:universal stress protein [Candidatus Dormibacteraeota bacterium]
MFRTIVVPVDGSPPSNAGVDLALRIARAEGGRVVFCSVREPLPATGVGDVPPELEHAHAEEVEAWWCERLLREAAERAERAGIPHEEMRPAAGDVVEAILAAARDTKGDLIVMGSHGRGGLERALLGSKTEGVLRRAQVPVCVAPAVRSS